ncbi:sensor histidine kinase [Bacillus badius]|uniref:histidine kinase n=1 Tax=Bacillus badius TaxID=1455 RepID=A0ABR5AU11_BACBA|nr:HAMP domain-containing sensor histidine kinase [Bacillus badius]KIL72749.1 sensor histidine kinase [Bacillus badius]KIL78230.1 sensor histidine kinase [Bacillus badius]MED4718662.1 HAMP domain-containing sensor histidine kinase [Bacillus badius]
MKLRNRVAYYFVSRLFWLMLLWSSLIVINIILFNFFFGHNRIESPQISINQIAEQTTLVYQKPSVNSKIQESLVKNKMWLQILDEQGNEVFSFNKPQDIPSHYGPGELVSDYLYPAKKGYQLSTWYKATGDAELTWVLGKPMTDKSPVLYWMNVLWVLFMILIGILIAVFFGRQLGAPLLYIVSWIDNLAKGKYTEPFYYQNFHLQRRWRNKAEYQTYQELMQALSELTSILQRNTDERELLEKTREEWMTGVSHDLKTPLSVIKGYTVLLSSPEYQWEQKDIRHFSKIMEERVSYMEELIEDFNLTFQLKNEAVPLKLEQKNLVILLKDALEQLNKLPEAKNKMFSLETTDSKVTLDMDSRYLRRAFENLLSNSIKHNPPGTRIKVLIHKNLSSPKYIRVLIEDDGIGMDQETADHLFDRYYRGTSTSSSTPGTGLGMAIAKQIIINHGGEMTICSKPQLGTQYIITFPLQRPIKKSKDSLE